MVSVVWKSRRANSPRYRHQLNHTRKQIFTCDIGECTRQFVRQDLCNRHRERHTAPGSQLQRKDAMQNNVSAANAAGRIISHGSMSPELARIDSGAARTGQIPFVASGDNSFNTFSPTRQQPPLSFSRTSSTSQSADVFNGYQPPTQYRRSQSDQTIRSSQAGVSGQPYPRAGVPQRQCSFSTADGKLPDTYYSQAHPAVTISPFAAPSQGPQQQGYGNFQQGMGGGQGSAVAPFVGDHGFAPFSLPPSSFSPGPTTTSSTHDFHGQYTMSSPQTTMPSDYQNRDFGQSDPDMMYLDQIGGPETMPVFGNESFENQRSPFAIADNFVAYIFNAQQYNMPQDQTASQSIMNSYNDAQNQYQPFLPGEFNLGGYFPQNQQHPMAVTSLLDPSTPDMMISDEKSQEVVDLIKDRFNEADHDAVPRQKEAILEGDRCNDSHVLSRKMMQIYIDSFWRNFHPQLPICKSSPFSHIVV